MYMILFVLNNMNHLDKVLEKWNEIGIEGVTIIESTGIHRLLTSTTPMRYQLGDSRLIEVGNYTLISIVPNKELIAKCIKATEAVVGSLNQPNTGILVSWQLGQGKGMHKVPRKG
jgi:nitrogen regulatory protein P-II 1